MNIIKKSFKSSLLKNWPKVLASIFFIILFGAYVNIFAVFTPGQTLDPNCAPGVVGCVVSSGSSSPWTADVNGITYSAGNVGIGSSSNTSSAINIPISTNKHGIYSVSTSSNYPVIDVTNNELADAGVISVTNFGHNTNAYGVESNVSGSGARGIYSYVSSGNNSNSIAVYGGNESNSLSGVYGGYFAGFNSTGAIGVGAEGINSDVFLLSSGILRMRERAVSPGTPNTDSGFLYSKTDGKIYFKNDGGTEYDLTSTGGASQNLQQTFDAGSLFDKDNAIDTNGHALTIDIKNPLSPAAYGSFSFDGRTQDFPQFQSSFTDGIGQSTSLYQGYDGILFNVRDNTNANSYFSFDDDGFGIWTTDLSGGGAPTTGLYSNLGEVGMYGGALYLDILGNTTGAGYVLTDVNGDGYATWQPVSGGSSQWTTSGSGIYFDTGNIGIGMNNSNASMSVKSQAPIIGSELISNGTFTGSATGWTFLNGAYNNNNATMTYPGSGFYGRATTTFSVESGKKYLLRASILNVANAGMLYFNLTNATTEDKNLIEGNNSVIITATATGTATIVFENWGWTAGGTWTIDDVSVKEVSGVSNALDVYNYEGTKLLSVGGNDLSNFIYGKNSGLNNTDVTNSNFFGQYSGYQALYVYDSNFFGQYSGYQAENAGDSNFFGEYAGYGATEAYQSNFFGNSAGLRAVNADDSNFFGLTAGQDAINAPFSNFFGYSAGVYATNADNSNFFGTNAGGGAANASNSIFIGQNAGDNDNVNNTGNINDFSILIGKNTGTGGFSNSIAIGGSAVNTATNQFMIGSTTRPINTTVWKGASTTATLDTATGLITTSDERLKTNILDLPNDTLSKLVNVKTVTFNWLNGDNNKTNMGFLAQDLRNYFPELVYENTDGYLGVNYANMTPVLTEAIREMNLKLDEVLNFGESTPLRDKIIIWFGDVNNGIINFVANTIRAKNQLCVGEGNDEVCITKDELLLMKNNLNQNPGGSYFSNDSTSDPLVNEEVTPVPPSEGESQVVPAIEVSATGDEPSPEPVIEAPVEDIKTTVDAVTTEPDQAPSNTPGEAPAV